MFTVEILLFATATTTITFPPPKHIVENVLKMYLLFAVTGI